MGGQQTIKVIIEKDTGAKPITDRAAHAAAFAQDLLPKEIPAWAEEVRAAVAASRRRTPIDQLLNSRQDDKVSAERRSIEDQISGLQERLKALGAV